MLSALRARVVRVRRERPDAGLTLTEIIVSMSIMTVAGTLALVWMVGSTKASSATTESSLTTAGARNAVSSWSNLLSVIAPPAVVDGAAAPRLSVTATSLSFPAQLDSKSSDCADSACTDAAPTSVRLELTGQGQLAQTLRGSDKQFLVPSGAALDTGCLFTPYTAAGTQLPCTGLTTSQVNSIARIDLSFVVTTADGAPQSYGTTVTLPGSTS